ncbi:MAG: ADP-heptose--LPS heptosyltransferase [Ignavibacteria bacterium RBG_13_36_8]|nr:MAG: ADP-heptose--LPS heptosyltransferase [Ignavibacteria bacterium RBG_13_36_8]
MKKQKRILIVRPDRVGDVVLSTPLPREIKKQYPGSFIAVLVRQYTKDIYLNNPYVDEILLLNDIPVKGFSSFWQKVKLLRRHRFTHALMLLPNERINYMMFFAGIRTRIGVGHKLYQLITFTKSVSRNKYIPLRHEADYCMDLARKIGVQSNNLDTEIHLTDEEKKTIEELKKIYCPNSETLIGIHTTYGYSTPNIKPEEYRRLIDLLLKIPRVKVAVTDLEPENIIKNIPGVLYLSKSGREFFYDIAAMDMLVSSSTGPSHIAAALKIKTFTIFCRLPVCSHGLWAPKGNEAYFILPDENYCNIICSGDPKMCSFEGEGGINAGKIFQALKNHI